MNLLGQPAFVGRHCGSHEYDVTREGVDSYSDALDDRNPLYEEVAPPLLFHSECYQFLSEWYLTNLFGNLHGRQDWELFGAIPIGSRVRTRSTIIDRYAKRDRDYVVNETDIFDTASGQLFVRGRTHQSFLPSKDQIRDQERDQGDQGYVVDESSAKAKPPRQAFPVATGVDLKPTTKLVDARRCMLFSGPGRNYHTDAEEAKKFGFPNIVVQGMMTTCFTAQVMLEQFGMGFLEGGKMTLKLTNVLWADERVTAYGRIREEWPEGTRTRVACDVWVEKDDGSRVLIGNASALR